MSLYKALLTSKTISEVLEQGSITEIGSLKTWECAEVILKATPAIIDWFIENLPSNALENLHHRSIFSIAETKKPIDLEKLAKQGFSLSVLLHEDAQYLLETNIKLYTVQELQILKKINFPFEKTSIVAEIFLDLPQANKDWLIGHYEGKFSIASPEEFLAISAEVCLSHEAIYLKPSVILKANSAQLGQILEQLPNNVLARFKSSAVPEIALAKNPKELEKLVTKGFSLSRLGREDAQYVFEIKIKSCTSQELEILKRIYFPFNLTAISAGTFLSLSPEKQDWLIGHYAGKFSITTPEEFLGISASICLPLKQISLYPSVILNADGAQLDQIVEQLPDDALITLSQERIVEIAKAKNHTDLAKLTLKGFSLSNLNFYYAQDLLRAILTSCSTQKLEELKKIGLPLDLTISARIFLNSTKENKNWVIDNYRGVFVIQTPEEFLAISASGVCLPKDKISLTSSVIIDASTIQLNQIIEQLPDEALANLCADDALKIITAHQVADLEKLANKGLALAELQASSYTSFTAEKQNWFSLQGGKVIAGTVSPKQLEECQNQGLLPCFEEIPKTLNYIWLVDPTASTIKDPLNGKHKDEYLKNLQHNAVVLHDYKQILWTNCKKCIPVAINILEKEGFEIRELDQLPHLDNPKRACIASKLEKYNQASSASFIDMLKVLVKGVVADLNYGFDRELTANELRGGFITQHGENYFLGVSDNNPISNHLIDWFYNIVCVGKDSNSTMANNRNFVFDALEESLKVYPNVKVSPGSDDKISGASQTYYAAEV